MNISKALQYFCNLKDINQADISHRTGLSKPHVNQIYHGVVKNPKFQSVYLICKALDISIDEFVSIANRYN